MIARTISLPSRNPDVIRRQENAVVQLRFRACVRRLDCYNESEQCTSQDKVHFHNCRQCHDTEDALRVEPIQTRYRIPELSGHELGS